MAEKARYLSSERRGIRVLYKHTACEKAMEQWVRVQNERDRQVLAWLRERVGDAAIVAAAQACTRGDSKPYLSVICRQLGLSVPRLMSHYVSTDAAGERHLAAIYEILRLHSPDAHAAR
jgi:hypothetical protein